MSDAFQTPLDIANKALQLAGARRIVSFTDDSKEAAAVAFVYDKSRKAELERNVWAFTVKRAWLYPISLTTMRMLPAQWNAGTVYGAGAIVSYTDALGNNQVWYSRTGADLNQAPGTAGSPWEAFFGSLLVNQFIPQTGQSPYAYHAGDVVYQTNGSGSSQIFLSLYENNTDVPNVPQAWVAYQSPFNNGVLDPSLLSIELRIVGQYNKGDVVSYTDGSGNVWYYKSLIELNQSSPANSPFPWNQFTTYAAGATVAGKDGQTYASLVNSNVGIDPTTDSGANWENMFQPVPWTVAFQGEISSCLWLPISATLQAPNINYPLGAGPLEETFSKNVYPLPSNFMRRAPQDPRAGIVSFLGAPSGLAPDDFVIESGYLTSRFVDPIPLRYSANMTDVSTMSALFCTAVACRMTLDTEEELTQDPVKINGAEKLYSVTIRTAWLVNAIINGAQNFPEDDYIICRI